MRLDTFTKNHQHRNTKITALLNQSTYCFKAPTRNLQGAGEVFAPLTSFSRPKEFYWFLHNYFELYRPPESPVHGTGESFFRSVKACLGFECEYSPRLRAMAFENKGELDSLRSSDDYEERKVGCPITSSITPSALAEVLGICITVLRSSSPDPTTPQASQAAITRTTHSGLSGQCYATHEIFLLRNANGYSALRPIKNRKWDSFWGKMFGG